jgi:hypothetical protein
MANTADTAHLDRWGRPAWAGRPSDRFDGRYGGGYPAWHPARILLIVAGFIIWWPIGLAILAYTLWSRNMGCWSHDRHGRFADKMERMQHKMERMRERMEGRGYYAPSSGNRAFDDYRMETLRRLEEEQKEFKDFLERLRHAKDKEEFDAFMAQHRSRPTPPNDQPQG